MILLNFYLILLYMSNNYIMIFKDNNIKENLFYKINY